MENNSFFGSDWLGAFLIIAVLFGGFGGFGFGGGGAAAVDINGALATQSIQQSLGAIQLSSANNNYETARLIDNQTMYLMNQNNTNLVNAIQGFNTTTQALTSGFNSVNQNIANLGFKMEECCCSIKTMLLENRLQETEQELANARNQANISAQTQAILGTMGKWVANAPATTA